MAAEVGFQSQFSTGNLSGPQGGEAPAALGSLAGHQVQQASSPQSLLADAAEELTFSVDNTEELELKERPQRDAKKTDPLLEKVKLYQEMMEQRGVGKQIDALRRFLASNRSGQAAADQTREYFPDPSEGWAALKLIREELENGGADPEVLRAVDEALALMEKEQWPEIRSGLNGALAAAGYPGLGSPFELGGSYRQVSCDFADSLEMLEHILEKYGPEQFDEAMDFMMKSLAGDLASAQSGDEKAHLETVTAGLGQARVLKGACALNEKLLDRWDRVHGIDEHQLRPLPLLKEVIILGRESFIPQSRVENIVKLAQAPDIEKEVLFLQEFLATSRNYSPQVFDSQENRLSFVSAVQEAVDQAIVREDEYLASLETEGG